MSNKPITSPGRTCINIILYPETNLTWNNSAK